MLRERTIILDGTGEQIWASEALGIPIVWVTRLNPQAFSALSKDPAPSTGFGEPHCCDRPLGCQALSPESRGATTVPGRGGSAGRSERVYGQPRPVYGQRSDYGQSCNAAPPVRRFPPTLS